MNKENITVTMPVEEYERLRDIENMYLRDVDMFERANLHGEAIMTQALKKRIEEIYS